MKFYVDKNVGFCKGVQNAVDTALRLAKTGTVYTLGKLVHNDYVLRQLAEAGVVTAERPEDVPENATVIIRSHGAAPDVYERCRARRLNVVDATCPFVSLIAERAKTYREKGYQVVLVGQKDHPEIVGINGWCGGNAVVTDGASKCDLSAYEKVVILFQTTFDSEKYEKTLQNLCTDSVKTLEIFKTICYTTMDRQKYAHFVSERCDLIVVVGDRNSSNTQKLFHIAARSGKDVLWLHDADVPEIDLSKYDKIGFLSGASTPKELVKGVLKRMSEIAKEGVEVVNADAESKAAEMMKEAASQIGKRCHVGQVVDGLYVMSNADGVFVRLPNLKQEAFIPNDNLSLEQDYAEAKAALKDGDVLKCLVVSTDNGKIVLSRKAIEEREKDDGLVEGIRNGEQFEIVASRAGKDCLIGRLGSYTVIVHASQIRMGYVKDLKPYIGKKLRLVASPEKINDEERKISASQRAVLIAEKQAREDAFWNNIEVNEIVEGKVLRFAPFGAFVSVNNFDCLAHSSDLSWDKINGPEDVLEIGKTYEFVVLALDREKSRVSLGYKQLQPKPWDLAAEKFPVGSVVKGKVARILSFGAFIELDKNIDGLLHISNVSWEWLDDISKVLKVGEEIEVEVMEFDAENKRITLSRKALLAKPEDMAQIASSETSAPAAEPDAAEEPQADEQPAEPIAEEQPAVEENAEEANVAEPTEEPAEIPAKTAEEPQE